MLQGLSLWFDIKYFVHLEFNVGLGSWDLKWLIIGWSDIGWARSNYVHLFYSLNVVIWVCLKFRSAEKLWVDISMYVSWFVSRESHVHAGYTLQNSVYKIKDSFPNLIDLSD